ncbi:MAG: hypothetical protein AB1646_11310 [Thermodesulfobacteriota bacterium]
MDIDKPHGPEAPRRPAPELPETLDRESLQKALASQARILIAWGDREEARILLKEEEAICRELGLQDELRECLRAQAECDRPTRGPADSLTLVETQDDDSADMPSKEELQVELARQAQIAFEEWGDKDEALTLLQQQEEICREEELHAGLAQSLSMQADILAATGNLTGALELLKEQGTLCGQLTDKECRQKSLARRAEVLEKLGDLKGAVKALKEQEIICREIGDRKDLQRALGGQARIFRARRPNRALALLQEQEEICREEGLKEDLQQCLSEQALMYKRYGRPERALVLLLEQEVICREIGARESLQVCLRRQAVIRKAQGDPVAALTLFEQEEHLCKTLDLTRELAESLVNQAYVVSNDLHRPIEALPLLEEAFALASAEGHGKLLERITALRANISLAQEERATAPGVQE